MFKVYVTNDFGSMSEKAASIVESVIVEAQAKKSEAVLGLATGNSPTGVYKILAESANRGKFDPRRVRSFNLDEYIGLPGENAQDRTMHPESYAFFMIQEFFSKLDAKFAESCVPYGSLVDAKKFAEELERNPGDWKYRGADAGKSVVISNAAKCEYLSYVRGLQTGYEARIKSRGGIDVQVIGSGGRGHVAFHEAGIPFEDSRVLVVKLDDNTIRNAVADGHFAKESDSPRYAMSMGAELVYEARNVVLVANGERKKVPIARSLFEDPSPEIPISYGQVYAKKGGNLSYVVDSVVGAELAARKPELAQRGIELIDLR